MSAVKILTDPTTFVTSLIKPFGTYNVFSAKTMPAGYQHIIHVPQDPIVGGADYVTGHSTLIGTAADTLEVVSQGLTHVVEYHVNIGIVFQYTTATTHYVITAMPAGDIMTNDIAGATIYDWTVDANNVFLLLSDKIIQLETNEAAGLS